MMDRYEYLIFREHANKVFKLETSQDSLGQQYLTLYAGESEEVVPGVLQPTLQLLRFLALRAPKRVSNNDILAALWPKASSTIIDTHVSHLRAALNDPKDNAKLIEVIRGFGHRLMVPVTKEGDLGGVEVYPEWKIKIFDEFMSSVERSEDPTADLRILATAFSGSIVDLKLPALVKRGIRIQILMMNPDNKSLTDGRFICRTDKEYAELLHDLTTQIKKLRELSSMYEPDPKGAGGGSLEMRVSDLIPCGFVALSSDRALLGIYPAHCSYTLGPLLDIRGGTDLWRLLFDDWKARWPGTQV